MKLTELTGIKHLKGDSQQLIDFVNREFDLGRTQLSFLGKGAHAVALTNGRNVFKFWHKDSGYEAFAKHVIGHPDPFFPRIKGDIKTLPNILELTDQETGEVTTHDLRYVKMELLEPFDFRETRYGRVRVFKLDDEGGFDGFPEVYLNKQNLQNVIGILENIIQWAKDLGIKSEEEFIRQTFYHFLGVNDTHRELRKAKAKVHAKGKPTYIAHARAQEDARLKVFADVADEHEVTDEYRALVRDGIKLLEIPTEHGHFWDIRSSNFAWRGEQLVVLDPLGDITSNDLAYKLLRLADTKFQRRSDV